MPDIQTTFVDITSVVPASWFNRLQKHLAGFLNLKVTISGTTIVQVEAASSDGVASAYIGGEMRRNDTTVNHTFVAEAVDTWNVFVVATAAVDTFAVEVSQTIPATSPYRKVAEVDWDGADITELRGVRARIIDHGHDGVNQPQVGHDTLTGAATGDPHTAYSLPAGTRAFTNPVGGVYPVGATDLATKEYADDTLTNVPIGGVFYWPTADAAPTGFLLCDGSAVSRTTYDSLFAKLGTAFGNGDGSTTFNLPDMRGRMILGASDDGDRGDTGGSLEHTHTQSAHTHSPAAHTHAAAASHAHTVPSSGTGGDHDHTQGSSGSESDHTHDGPAHQHSEGTLAVASTASEIIGSREASSATAGLNTEQDLDNSSSSTSHSHGAGSYTNAEEGLEGTSSSGSFSHTHPPAGFAYAHTHTAGALTGWTNMGGTGTTGAGGSHSHTNPNVTAVSGHSHTAGGDTGSASPGANSAAAGTTGSSGADETGSATVPYLTMNAIIRYE